MIQEAWNLVQEWFRKQNAPVVKGLLPFVLEPVSCFPKAYFTMCHSFDHVWTTFLVRSPIHHSWNYTSPNTTDDISASRIVIFNKPLFKNKLQTSCGQLLIPAGELGIKRYTMGTKYKIDILNLEVLKTTENWGWGRKSSMLFQEQEVTNRK